VVILGAGFGGLAAAPALARAPVEITGRTTTCSSRCSTRCPAPLSPGDIAWPVRAVFRRQRNVSVLMA
jgi:NADH:ubiquinone reductase (H+-translocating)